VETSRSHQVRKDGSVASYERHLLRRSFRDGGKVHTLQTRFTVASCGTSGNGTQVLTMPVQSP
jgi:hypothetical protein